MGGYVGAELAYHDAEFVHFTLRYFFTSASASER